MTRVRKIFLWLVVIGVSLILIDRVWIWWNQPSESEKTPSPASSNVSGRGRKLIRTCMSGEPDCRIDWDHDQTIETSKTRVLVKFTESGKEKSITFGEFIKRDLSNFEPMELKFETVSGKQPDIVEIYQKYN